MERAIAIDGNYAPAFLWMGSWQLHLDQPELAAKSFQQAVALGATSEGQFGQARAMMAMGQDDRALPMLRAFAHQTDHPYVYRTLGRALRALGRMDDARQAMERGRDARPYNWTDPRSLEKSRYTRGYASFANAQALSSHGDTREAIEIFERLRRRYPTSGCGRTVDYFFSCNLINSLSIAYGRAGKTEDAVSLALEGLATNPGFSPFYLTIADHYRQKRDLDTALEYIDQAIELDPKQGHAHAQRGRFLFGLGRHEKARSALESALRFEPANRTTVFYLGIVATELQDWGEAVSRFKQVVALDPTFAVGHLYLSRSLGEAGLLEEARAALDRAEATGADPDGVRLTKRRFRDLEAGVE